MNLQKKISSPFPKFHLTNLDSQYPRLLRLNLTQCRVWFIILGNVDRDNHCRLTIQDISNRYGIAQPNVSASVKVLESHCLIYRIKRKIIVDPNYCWHGDAVSHHKALADHAALVPYYDDVLARLNLQPF